MAAETQYTANTGAVAIATANTNLDGTGTLGTVLTGASNGTLIVSVTIKAIVNTTQGMVRLFVNGGGTTQLIAEIEIPAVTKSGDDPAFETRLPLNYALKSGYILKASTEKAETFNVIGEGLDWVYYASSVRPESTEFTANTGMTTISTANTNLDGSGTLGTVLTAASNGTSIQSITIKSQVTTSVGMVRIYVYDGSSTAKLLAEVRVPAVTKSATAHSFTHKITFGGDGFALKAGWALKASTQIGEAFNVIAEGLDWTYPA